MKKTIIIAIIIGVLIAILVFRACISSISRTFSTVQIETKLDSESYLKNAPKEYLQLFSTQHNDLALKRTDVNKRRNPISEFYYKNQFYIMVYKIDTIDNLALDLNINEDFLNSNFPDYINYAFHTNNTKFEIGYKEGEQEKKINKVFISIYGTQNNIITKSDNMVYYYSNCKNFSIKYNKNAAIDIYGNVGERFEGETVPLEIMFLKRNGNLYFIVLAPINNQDKFNINTLYKLIRGK